MRPEQVPEVRRWLDNYQTIRQGLEAIYELYHELSRAGLIADEVEDLRVDWMKYANPRS